MQVGAKPINIDAPRVPYLEARKLNLDDGPPSPCAIDAMFVRHALFRIRRSDPPPAAVAKFPLEFARATSENVEDVAWFRDARVVNILRQHLELRQVGVLAYHEGRAVAHGWLIANRTAGEKIANGYVRLQPREALVHFCAVAEPYRGQGVYRALLCELYREAFATEPVDTIYVDTAVGNVASRRAIEKTATFVRHMSFLKVLSRRWQLPW